MRAIQRRRRFKDPRCRACGPVAVVYSWGANGRGRQRIHATCGGCNGLIKAYARNKVPARIKLALNPGEVKLEIRYPSYPSEFEVQAFLYSQLRALGYDARGEVTTRDGEFRFDIVIFAGIGRSRRPVRIIEVKDHAKSYRRKQIEAYGAYGVKVIAVCGMEQARALIERAKAGAKAPLSLWDL